MLINPTPTALEKAREHWRLRCDYEGELKRAQVLGDELHEALLQFDAAAILRAKADALVEHVQEYHRHMNVEKVLGDRIAAYHKAADELKEPSTDA